jgi:hypothetical protein
MASIDKHSLYSASGTSTRRKPRPSPLSDHQRHDAEILGERPRKVLDCHLPHVFLRMKDGFFDLGSWESHKTSDRSFHFTGERRSWQGRPEARSPPRLGAGFWTIA